MWRRHQGTWEELDGATGGRRFLHQPFTQSKCERCESLCCGELYSTCNTIQYNWGSIFVTRWVPGWKTSCWASRGYSAQSVSAGPGWQRHWRAHAVVLGHYATLCSNPPNSTTAVIQIWTRSPSHLQTVRSANSNILIQPVILNCDCESDQALMVNLIFVSADVRYIILCSVNYPTGVFGSLDLMWELSVP